MGFTKGPWEYVPDNNGYHYDQDWKYNGILDSDGNCIVEVQHKHKVYKKNVPHADLPWEANAHLIAAAPDMYEALKSFPGFIDNATIGDKWLEKMRMALAKADGK